MGHSSAEILDIIIVVLNILGFSSLGNSKDERLSNWSVNNNLKWLFEDLTAK